MPSAPSPVPPTATCGRSVGRNSARESATALARLARRVLRFQGMRASALSSGERVPAGRVRVQKIQDPQGQRVCTTPHPAFGHFLPEGEGRCPAASRRTEREHEKAPMKYSYDELAGMIDHSLLHPTLTDAELEAGCALAAMYRVASVCVKPYAVRRSAELLKGTSVLVGCVVGFPHGNSATEVKRYETEVACRDGA